jgi:hypothetical protein
MLENGHGYLGCLAIDTVFLQSTVAFSFTWWYVALCFLLWSALQTHVTVTAVLGMMIPVLLQFRVHQGIQGSLVQEDGFPIVG